jgi:hypothetical protein
MDIFTKLNVWLPAMMKLKKSSLKERIAIGKVMWREIEFAEYKRIVIAKILKEMGWK